MGARVAAAFALAAAGCLVAACTGTQVSGATQIDEPLRVESGQFIAGALPGVAPPDAAAASPDAGVNPQVTDINVGNTAIAQGEQGLVFSGHTTADAQTVAVRFADMGTGYWVVPVGGLDPSDGNLPTWQLTADFGRDLPPGDHDLVFTAISATGASGTQNDLEVCLDTPVPDNLNVCVPRRAPPAAVLSLSWDTPVDLDLVIRTPSGAVVGGGNVTGVASADGGGGSSTPASDGVVDRESNRNCVIDNIDRQDIVWQTAPPAGTYEVWVDLFNACHQASVTFNVALWLAETGDGGTKRLVQQPPLASGELLAEQANGGSSLGLFVGEFQLR
jgi:hypothetical protein